MLSHNVATSRLRKIHWGRGTGGRVAVFRAVMKGKQWDEVTERRPWTWPSALSCSRHLRMMQWQLLEIAVRMVLARCKETIHNCFAWKEKEKKNIGRFLSHTDQSDHLGKFTQALPYSYSSDTALCGFAEFSVLPFPLRFVQHLRGEARMCLI